jgi:hypothetical protein
MKQQQNFQRRANFSLTEVNNVSHVTIVCCVTGGGFPARTCPFATQCQALPIWRALTDASYNTMQDKIDYMYMNMKQYEHKPNSMPKCMYALSAMLFSLLRNNFHYYWYFQPLFT